MLPRLIPTAFSSAKENLISFIPSKRPEILTFPAVFDCGNEYYNVMWHTSKKGSGYVKVTVGNEEKIYWDAVSGVIRTDDTVHSVLVPKTVLRGNTYKAGSQNIAYKYGYTAVKGGITETKPITFRGTEKEDGINILILTDIHEDGEKMHRSLSHFTDEADILVFLGDCTSNLETKKKFTEHILKYAGSVSHGEIPVIYTRGNHETRGEYASRLLRYFPSNTGEFYFTFDFGSLSAIVLDSGEDKEDSHVEYSGLIDFSSYREKEYNWICSLKKEDFKGRYKIVFCHHPGIDDHFGKNWLKPLKELDFSLLIGGHYHRSELTAGEISKFVACGKCENFWAASSITLKDGKANLVTVNSEGKIILKETVEL